MAHRLRELEQRHEARGDPLLDGDVDVAGHGDERAQAAERRPLGRAALLRLAVEREQSHARVPVEEVAPEDVEDRP